MVLYEIPGGYELNRNLVGYWKLDDLKLSGATAIIDRASFNDGTISGGVSAATDMNGITGNAMDFDGDEDFIDITNASPLDFNNNFTISFSWFVRGMLSTAPVLIRICIVFVELWYEPG